MNEQQQQDLESSYSGVSSTVEPTTSDNGKLEPTTSDNDELEPTTSDNDELEPTTSEKEQSSDPEPTFHNITQSNEGDVQGGMQAAGDHSHLLQANANVNLYLRDKGGIGQHTQTEQNEETFSDPTSPYFKDGQLFGFKSDDLPSYSNTLQKENIILVSCFHHSILKAAADALAESLNKVVDKRYLNLDIDNKTSLDLDFLKDKELGNKEGSLVVVNSVRTAQFLDWLTTYNDELAIGNFKNELKIKNRFLICLISSEMLEKTLQSQMQERLLFSHWQVPFLPHLTKEAFPMHATEIEEKIPLQRKKGLWGSSEKEFYELVYSFTKSGHLFQEVEKREVDDAREILDRDRTEASSIFKDDEDLENIVFYVAVFFPELTPNSFYQLVSSLIAKDTTFVTVTEVVTESEETKVVEKQQEKLLIDIWKKKSDKILKKCHLKAIKFQEKNRVIDFDSPYLRKDLREYIETEYSTFFRNNFQRVQEIGLLFGNSPRVTENVIRLYASVAESYSEDYGADWLIQVILRSAKRFGLEVDSYPNQEKLLFGKLLELETLKDELVLNRISSLIREILNYPQLQSMVNSFLERLISWTYHKALLAIVERLRSVPQFDLFYWIRQLLERGNDETIQRANRFLQKLVMQSGFRIYELLENLKIWLPELNRNIENYSTANKVVLEVFYNYCSETTRKFPIQNYGKWPPRHPLLAVLSKSSSRANLETLFYWLFHHGSENVSQNFDIDYLRGRLIEDWWNIIHGFEKVDISSEVVEAINTFVSVVITSTTSNQQEKLLAFFKNRKQELWEEIASKADDTKKPKLTFELRNKVPAKVQQDIKIAKVQQDIKIAKVQQDIKILNHKRQMLRKLTQEFSALKG